MAPSSYPSSLDTFTNPTGGQVQGSTTPTHAGHHANVNDAIEAIEAKLGTGTDIAAANEVLRGTGAGATAFGQVVTGDIAPNAVSQVASASISPSSAATTASTTLGDLPGATVTLTTTGGPVLVLFWAEFRHSVVGALIYLALMVDGVDQGVYPELVVPSSGAHTAFTFSYRITPSAASHTIKVQWAVSGAAGTATVEQANGMFTVLELKR